MDSEDRALARILQQAISQGDALTHTILPPGMTPAPLGAPPTISRRNPTPEDIATIKAAAKEGGHKPWPDAQRPIFDTSVAAHKATDKMVPQVSVKDQLPPLLPGNQMPAGDRMGFLRDNYKAVGERMAERLEPMVKRDDPMLYFYGTGPVMQGLQKYAGHTPQESVSFMRDWAGQGAATSPQTKTPPNLRNASWLLYNMAQGNPVTPEKWKAEGNTPGYGMMGMHVGLGEGMRKGTIDPWKNPKPYTFREGWSGNTKDVVADMHVGRQNLLEYDNAFPGSLPPGLFRSKDVYQQYRDAGSLTKAFKDLSSVFTETSSPTKALTPKRPAVVEYPIQQLPLTHAAGLLGITPGQAQSGGWFEYGKNTGLGSPPQTVPMLLNNQIEATSKALGVPSEKVLEWWGRGKIPLSSNAPEDVPYA
jgi:hypothetical protein